MGMGMRMGMGISVGMGVGVGMNRSKSMSTWLCWLAITHDRAPLQSVREPMGT